jgi:negative regulator of replication initiation
MEQESAYKACEVSVSVDAELYGRFCIAALRMGERPEDLHERMLQLVVDTSDATSAEAV